MHAYERPMRAAANAVMHGPVMHGPVMHGPVMHGPVMREIAEGGA